MSFRAKGSGRLGERADVWENAASPSSDGGTLRRSFLAYTSFGIGFQCFPGWTQRGSVGSQGVLKYLKGTYILLL